MRILFAILALSLATITQADGIYKWVDENGVVHFGSQPPQKIQVEVVKAPKSQRFKQWQQEQDALVAERQMKTDSETAEAAPSKPERPAVAPAEAPSKAELAARAQRCKSAQLRLQELQNHSRVREVDANGNYRVLGEEERQQRIRQAQQVVQTNC